jgi:hypothetical protein
LVERNFKLGHYRASDFKNCSQAGRFYWAQVEFTLCIFRNTLKTKLIRMVRDVP